jgi:alpha-tubulin suppressor-like RCC1 family protein
VDSSQVVRCWGSSVHGELGTAGEAAPGLAGATDPRAAHTTQRFLTVTAGYHFSCAVSVVGRVWCWGRGADGQLGNGGTWDWSAPQPASTGDLSRQFTARQVTAGINHACALAAGAAAYCWGRGDNGELGAGARTRTPLAVRVQTE